MTDAPQPVVAPGASLPGVLGFETVESGPERAVGRFEVADRVRQPYGWVHGGAYAAMAEGLASRASFEAVVGGGMLAAGLSNNTSFLRPVTDGTVEAEARRIHRGQTTWIWDVEFRDDEGRLCAISRITVAVRPLPLGVSPESGS